MILLDSATADPSTPNTEHNTAQPLPAESSSSSSIVIPGAAAGGVALLVIVGKWMGYIVLISVN